MDDWSARQPDKYRPVWMTGQPVNQTGTGPGMDDGSTGRPVRPSTRQDRAGVRIYFRTQPGGRDAIRYTRARGPGRGRPRKAPRMPQDGRSAVQWSSGPGAPLVQAGAGTGAGTTLGPRTDPVSLLLSGTCIACCGALGSPGRGSRRPAEAAGARLSGVCGAGLAGVPGRPPGRPPGRDRGRSSLPHRRAARSRSSPRLR
jgi:hypothetical protein